VLVCEAVFETVGPIAFVAVHARHERGVDEGFALRVGALLLVGEDIGLCGYGVGLGSAI
jgi:hypothetical protein